MKNKSFNPFVKLSDFFRRLVLKDKTKCVLEATTKNSYDCFEITSVILNIPPENITELYSRIVALNVIKTRVQYDIYAHTRSNGTTLEENHPYKKLIPLETLEDLIWKIDFELQKSIAVIDMQSRWDSNVHIKEYYEIFKFPEFIDYMLAREGLKEMQDGPKK
jgi:hypothetical protein